MNLENNAFYTLNLLYNSKRRSWFILIFLIFIRGTLFGQNTNVNECNFKFNVKIEKQDSIPLKNKHGKIIKYWTQSEFEYIVSYVTIDSSSVAISRIKSIDEVIINYGESFYNRTQIDSLNQAIDGLWISNDYLKTNFAEWVFMMNRWSLSKDVNPNNENYFFIYSKPTTKSNKETLDINDLFEEEDDATLYKIKVLECKGRWAKIKISVKKLEIEIIGWMPWYNFCYNILTTCTNGPKALVENEE